MHVSYPVSSLVGAHVCVVKNQSINNQQNISQQTAMSDTVSTTKEFLDLGDLSIPKLKSDSICGCPN